MKHVLGGPTTRNKKQILINCGKGKMEFYFSSPYENFYKIIVI